MAPRALSLEMLPPKGKNRLGKPTVEKLRRDRSSSSIEQLERLLQTELPRRRPSSKPEKADVLETTARLLRRSQAAARSLQRDQGEGYGRCLEDALRLPAPRAGSAAPTQAKLLGRLQRAQAAPAEPGASRCGPRPSRRL